MSIKLYLNGTPGGTDGAEINSLTFKNLMAYSKGIGSSNSYNATTILPVCLREESGKTATDVKVQGIITDAVQTYCSGYGYSTYPTDGFSMYSKTSGSIGGVGSTNVLVFLAISAKASVASGTNLFSISYVEN